MFLLYFSKQCLVGNIQRKFKKKNSSVIFISEEPCVFAQIKI